MVLRKIHFATISAAAALLITAQPASARDLPGGGMTRPEVAAWLGKQGIQATQHNDSNGADILSGATNGVNFDVYFYDCDADRCRSIQFAAGWSGLQAMTAQRINDWNKDKRFIRAYLTPENKVFGEYDLVVSPGGTWEELDHAFVNWRSMIVDFKSYILK